MVIEKIRSVYPEVEVQDLADKTQAVYITPEKIIPFLTFLRDDEALQFNFLSEISVVDYREYLEVVYHIASYPLKQELVVKAKLGMTEPSIDTAVNVYQAADWLEREQWEMYGVVFNGHPNLKRLLLADDFPGFPMLKSFPLENKEDYLLQEDREEYVPSELITKLDDQ